MNRKKLQHFLHLVRSLIYHLIYFQKKNSVAICGVNYSWRICWSPLVHVLRICPKTSFRSRLYLLEFLLSKNWSCLFKKRKLIIKCFRISIILSLWLLILPLTFQQQCFSPFSYPITYPANNLYHLNITAVVRRGRAQAATT